MSGATQIKGRVLAKCEARARVYRRFYAEFDHLDKPCRDAMRERGGWDKFALAKCSSRTCAHQAASIKLPVDDMHACM